VVQEHQDPGVVDDQAPLVQMKQDMEGAAKPGHLLSFGMMNPLHRKPWKDPEEVNYRIIHGCW
jgi:hypothetical protein